MFRWRWAVVAIVATAAGFVFSLRAVPHLHPFVTSSSACAFSLVALALTVSSAILAPATRAAVVGQRWIVLSCDVIAYLCLAFLAFAFTSIT
jgi:hypothetical protein